MLVQCPNRGSALASYANGLPRIGPWNPRPSVPDSVLVLGVPGAPPLNKVFRTLVTGLTVHTSRGPSTTPVYILLCCVHVRVDVGGSVLGRPCSPSLAVMALKSFEKGMGMTSYQVPHSFSYP